MLLFLKNMVEFLLEFTMGLTVLMRQIIYYRIFILVHKELKGLLWDDGGSPDNFNSKQRDLVDDDVDVVVGNEDKVFDDCSQCVDQEKMDSITRRKKKGKNWKNKYKDAAKKHEENHRRWKCEWD
ncbi:unnamed protein product [Trifolium pratense]|uniref:Uncharacterized protein n=1 Tax=Trifolium pratense TaxID=57577 RepID=A0ACB0J6Q1_TRIPR|nr:unnamed protein product [Trifolium pratense]